MPIKVVCITKADGETKQRVILEKVTSPANLIAVADRFLSLSREHGIANGEQFVGLICSLDDKVIQTRLLIENASTAFHLLRQRMFGDCGFTVYKHEPDVKLFMQMIMSGQPLNMAPPVWTGKVRKPSARKAGAKDGSGDDADETGDDAIIAAISKQTKVTAEEQAPPSAAAAPATSSQSKARRKMTTANLGALGSLNSPS